MKITVKEVGPDQIEIVVRLLNQLPEFDTLFYKRKLLQRIGNKPALYLVAYIDEKPVGCKIGYNRYFDGSFYSWLGGVLPEYRKRGVAQALMDRLVKLVQDQFYSSIRVKTRNRHVGMLRLLIKNNFTIIDFEKKVLDSESRIGLRKDL